MLMFSRLLRVLWRDRRAAIAVLMAIMTVPLTIAGSAAVDLTRVMTARAILQQAADAAAVSGAGAWETSESANTAKQVANQAFAASTASIAGYAPLASGSPGVTLVCTGTSAQCGSGSYATSGPTGCVNYCVIVNASVTLTNVLFSYLAHTTTVSVTAGVSVALPPEQVNGANIPPSPGFGSAGDHSDIYAYAVSPNGSSQTQYNYGGVPAPNQDCANITGVLTLLPETNQTDATSCNFLFVADSESAGTSGAGGSITLQPGQPIAFAFIDDTGSHGYTQTGGASTTQLVVSKNSGTLTYFANGETVNVYTTTTTKYSCAGSGYYLQSGNDSTCIRYVTDRFGRQTEQTETSTVATSTATADSGTTGTSSTCTAYNSSNDCTNETTVAVALTNTQQLSAACPAETLYGALSSGYGAPTADNIDEYSSAPEVMGYPPTYLTNHALVPFVSTAVSTFTPGDGNSYAVQAMCPNYAVTGTSISAPISSAEASAIANYYTSGSSTYGGTSIANIGNLNINIFSTAFPGQTFSGSGVDDSGVYNSTSTASPTDITMTSGTSNVYPPAIAGCTPAISAQDGGVTTSAVDPWWNWNTSNTGNCSNESSSSQSSYFSSGQPAYGDCALVIQPLGTAVPTISVTLNGAALNEAVMPDYYLIVSTAQTPTASTIVALDPVWDGQTFTDQLGSVITNHLGGNDNNITVTGSTVTDKDTGPTFTSSGGINTYGYVPTATNAYKLTSGTYAGDYVIIEQPAQNGNTGGTAPYDFNLPNITSYQCYDPQKNGNPAGEAVMQEGGGATTTYVTIGDHNNGSAADPIANPQLGAIICSSNPPETYALYWNDLGTYGSDDLGYWNAVVSFTCPVPSSINGGGPTELFE
jgi:Flp pilus assembly protein TadG